MRFKFAAPFVYDRHRWDRRRIAQRTERPAQHVLGQVLDVVDVLLQPAAVVEARERLLQPVRAFAARNTPAATFVLVELHNAQGKFDHASLVVEHDHAAGAQELSALAEGIKVHVHLVGFFGGEHERRRTARDHGFELASVGNSAADLVNHLLQRISQRKFVNSRLIDVSAQAEEARSAILGRAKFGELLSPHKQDVRHGSQRLDIVDDRRAAPQTNHSRERGTNSRNAALAFQRFHQRGLFAYFVSPSAGVPANVEVLPAAEDVLAEKAFRICVGDRFAHNVDEIAVLAANVYEANLRANGQSCDHNTFDYSVRIVFQNQAIFAGAGLALITVDQNVLRLGGFFGNKSPLHAGREACAAASTKVRSLDLINNVVRLHLECFFDGLVAVKLQIAVKVGRSFAKSA